MKQLLKIIAQDLNLEALWLNTLSLLEHIGSKKISKSILNLHPSLEILEHFADEARHAFIFKKLNRHLLTTETEGYLCRDEAISYFQMLDGTISEWVNEVTQTDDPYYKYLFVTCTIERRAMKIYPLYMNLTQHPQVREALSKIILEETNHLQSIEAQAKGILKQYKISDFSVCRNVEDNLFQVFIASIKKNLHGLDLPASEKPEGAFLSFLQ